MPDQRIVGAQNLIRVRAYFASHLGCTNVECARALGLSIMAVGRHVATLRANWQRSQRDWLYVSSEVLS